MAERDENCIFCRIAAGELSTPFVDEGEHVVAFDDLEPQAPTHVLIVPRLHVESIDEPAAIDPVLLAETVQIAQRIAHARGISTSGYRLLTNVGPDAGQSVFHLHWHLLGGTAMRLLN